MCEGTRSLFIIIGSGDGLSIQRKSIIGTNSDLLSVEPKGMNLSKNYLKTQHRFLQKMFERRRRFCSDLKCDEQRVMYESQEQTLCRTIKSRWFKKTNCLNTECC